MFISSNSLWHRKKCSCNRESNLNYLNTCKNKVYKVTDDALYKLKKKKELALILNFFPCFSTVKPLLKDYNIFIIFRIYRVYRNILLLLQSWCNLINMFRIIKSIRCWYFKHYWNMCIMFKRLHRWFFYSFPLQKEEKKKTSD